MPHPAETAFDKQTIKLPCRHCRKKTPLTVAWARKHNKFACAGCGMANNLDIGRILLDLSKARKSPSDPVKNGGSGH